MKTLKVSHVTDSHYQIEVVDDSGKVIIELQKHKFQNERQQDFDTRVMANIVEQMKAIKGEDKIARAKYLGLPTPNNIEL
jgi:hypothetical protein